MGTEIVRTLAKEEDIDFLAFPPGFESYTSFKLIKIEKTEREVSSPVPPCLSQETQESVHIKTEPDHDDARKIAKSLRSRPWINYGQFNNYSDDDCDSEQLDEVSFFSPILLNLCVKIWPPDFVLYLLAALIILRFCRTSQWKLPFQKVSFVDVQNVEVVKRCLLGLACYICDFTRFIWCAGSFSNPVLYVNCDVMHVVFLCLSFRPMLLTWVEWMLYNPNLIDYVYFGLYDLELAVWKRIPEICVRGCNKYLRWFWCSI